MIRQILADISDVPDSALQYGVPDADRRYSTDDYFRWDAVFEGFLEYDNGQIKPASIGSPRQAATTASLHAALWAAARGSGWRGFARSLRVFACEANAFLHPSLTMIEGKVESGSHASGDTDGSVTNPHLICEVMHPRDQRHNYCTRFNIYATLPSFRAFVLVDPSKAFIEVSSRNPNGEWSTSSQSGDDATSHVPHLGIDLRHAEVFEGTASLT